MKIDINSETVKTDIYTAIAYQRGFLYKNEIPEICEDFEEVLKYFPNHKLTLSELASIYKSDNKEKSEEKLLKLISLYPENYEYSLNLLFLYEENEWDDKKEIESIVEKLDSVNYSTPKFFEWKANRCLKKGDVINTAAFLKKYLSLYPYDKEVHIRVAKLYYLMGEFVLAQKYLSKINPIKKTSTLYRIEGICNFFMENYKEALKILESVILIEPNDVYALYFLGDIEERRRRSWKSDHYFSKIVSRSSYSIDEMAITALSFLVLNETNRAEQYIQINLQKSPDHIFSQFINGIIMLSQKKFHKCYESLLQVYKYDYFLLRREFRLIKKSLKSKLVEEFISFLKNHDESLYLFFTLELDRDMFLEKKEKEIEKKENDS